MELNIQQINCQLHTKKRGYYTDDEMWEKYFNGELDDFVLPEDIAADKVDFNDYGYTFIECCDKWVEEEQWNEEQ